MIKKYFLRIMLVLGLLGLAACETTSPNKNLAQDKQDTTAQVETQAIDDAADATQGLVASNTVDTSDTSNAETADAQSSVEASETDSAAAGRPAAFAILLADVNPHAGWNKVDIGSGLLYFHPEPVLDRGDFQGVTATENDGMGMVVLEMNAEGQKHLLDKTTNNPDMMLAFVIETTLLSMIGYSEPVDSDFLAFSAGNTDNAVAVARAIAGVPETNANSND